MDPGESQRVPVDVLPPVPADAQQTPATVQPGLTRFYHPASGVIILALDWLAFGSDLFTDFIALPLMCVLSFLVSFPLIYAVQVKWSQDKTLPALGKAFLGAFMVGLPFPITGTMLGAAILALSGLPRHPKDVLEKLTSGRNPPSS
jgi:hypothetical protein